MYILVKTTSNEDVYTTPINVSDDKAVIDAAMDEIRTRAEEEHAGDPDVEISEDEDDGSLMIVRSEGYHVESTLVFTVIDTDNIEVNNEVTI